MLLVKDLLKKKNANSNVIQDRSNFLPNETGRLGFTSVKYYWGKFAPEKKPANLCTAPWRTYHYIKLEYAEIFWKEVHISTTKSFC